MTERLHFHFHVAETSLVDLYILAHSECSQEITINNGYPKPVSNGPHVEELCEVKVAQSCPTLQL